MLLEGAASARLIEPAQRLERLTDTTEGRTSVERRPVARVAVTTAVMAGTASARNRVDRRQDRRPGPLRPAWPDPDRRRRERAAARLASWSAPRRRLNHHGEHHGGTRGGARTGEARAPRTDALAIRMAADRCAHRDGRLRVRRHRLADRPPVRPHVQRRRRRLPRRHDRAPLRCAHPRVRVSPEGSGPHAHEHGAGDHHGSVAGDRRR